MKHLLLTAFAALAIISCTQDLETGDAIAIQPVEIEAESSIIQSLENDFGFVFGSDAASSIAIPGVKTANTGKRTVFESANGGQGVFIEPVLSTDTPLVPYLNGTASFVTTSDENYETSPEIRDHQWFIYFDDAFWNGEPNPGWAAQNEAFQSTIDELQIDWPEVFYFTGNIWITQRIDYDNGIDSDAKAWAIPLEVELMDAMVPSNFVATYEVGGGLTLNFESYTAGSFDFKLEIETYDGTDWNYYALVSFPDSIVGESTTYNTLPSGDVEGVRLKVFSAVDDEFETFYVELDEYVIPIPSGFDNATWKRIACDDGHQIEVDFGDNFDAGNLPFNVILRRKVGNSFSNAQVFINVTEDEIISICSDIHNSPTDYELRITPFQGGTFDSFIVDLEEHESSVTPIEFSNYSPSAGAVSLEVGENVTLSLDIANVPSGATVHAQALAFFVWSNVSELSASGNTYSYTTTAENLTALDYRFVVVQDDEVIDYSAEWNVTWTDTAPKINSLIINGSTASSGQGDDVTANAGGGDNVMAEVNFSNLPSGATVQVLRSVNDGESALYLNQIGQLGGIFLFNCGVDGACWTGSNGISNGVSEQINSNSYIGKDSVDKISYRAVIVGNNGILLAYSSIITVNIQD